MSCDITAIYGHVVNNVIDCNIICTIVAKANKYFNCRNKRVVDVIRDIKARRNPDDHKLSGEESFY